jgi:electron transfer flavoprotein beta subunit
MEVLVPVTDAASVDDEFEIDGLDVDDRYLTYELNEWDDYALEEAVRLSEAADDVDVVVASVGPERVEEAVRQALAKGADRAVRVWDDALAERDLLDPRAKAALLAGVAETVEPDLVLTGVQSGDAGFAATGVTLAEQLGFEWAAVVNHLDLDRGGERGETPNRASGEPASASPDVARVHRELEGGVEAVTDVELPAVLTVQTGINEPRYASLRGIRQAQNKPLDVRTPAEVGVDEAALASALRWTDTREPEAEGEATVFEGDADETAGQLAETLRESGVGQ